MSEVPFTREAFGGFAECHGLLKDEETHLTLEYQVQDAIAGMLKSEIREVRIPIDELVSIKLTNGWLGTSWLGVKIVIQATNLRVFENIPGSSEGRIELSIARRDVETAEHFIDEFHELQERKNIF
jgi:hypothetical protein